MPIVDVLGLVFLDSSKVERGFLCYKYVFLFLFSTYISEGFVNLSRESRERYDDVRNEIVRSHVNFNETQMKLSERLDL